MSTKVVIFIRNGLCEEVYSNNRLIEVEVLDLDTLDAKDRDERLKRLRDLRLEYKQPIAAEMAVVWP